MVKVKQFSIEMLIRTRCQGANKKIKEIGIAGQKIISG
jgi:hypothetical protein